MTQPYCTSPTGRHTWKWLRNEASLTVTHRADGSSTGHAKTRGLYQCQVCPAQRLGRMHMGGQDLRTLMPNLLPMLTGQPEETKE